MLSWSQTISSSLLHKQKPKVMIYKGYIFKWKGLVKSNCFKPVVNLVIHCHPYVDGKSNWLHLFANFLWGRVGWIFDSPMKTWTCEADHLGHHGLTEA